MPYRVGYVQLLKKRAENNDAPSQFLYGYHLRGSITNHNLASLNITPDTKEGWEWIHKSAEAGYAPAEFEIGQLYSKDAKQAAKWYKQAADQNYTPAQVRLSQHYSIEDLPDHDYAEAYFWANLALENEDADPKWKDFAEQQRNISIQHITQEQIKLVEKRVVEWKPLSVPAKAEIKP